MEVTRIYCNTEDLEEVLYSVLMTEDEMNFYQREFTNKANKAAIRRWRIQQAIDNGRISEEMANKYGGAEGIASAAEKGSRHTRVVDGERVVSGKGVTKKVARRQSASMDLLEGARNTPEGLFNKGSHTMGVYDAKGISRDTTVNDRINYRGQNQTGINKDQYSRRDKKLRIARERVLAKNAPSTTPKTPSLVMETVSQPPKTTPSPKPITPPTTPKPNPVATNPVPSSTAKTQGWMEQKARAAGRWIAKNPKKTAGIGLAVAGTGIGTAYAIKKHRDKEKN